MPKRLTLLEMYATSWFALTFVLSTDTYLSEFQNLYFYLISDETGWKTLIITFVIYPTYNVIFLNFFPKKKLKQALYVLGHSLIILAYERIATEVGVFHYNEWKLSYSAILYPLIFLILYLNLKLLRFLKNKESEKDERI